MTDMLESLDIVLAPLLAADSGLLWQWINERTDVIFSAPYKPVSESEHRAWFQSIQKRDDAVIFGIRRRDTDELVGTCQLVDVHPLHRHAELRIRIGTSQHRGCGFGSQAIELLLAFGFGDLNLHRIFLYVFEDNDRAIQVYRNSGFVEEGRLRDAAYVDGRFTTIVVMSVLKEEHDRRHSSA